MQLMEENRLDEQSGVKDIQPTHSSSGSTSSKVQSGVSLLHLIQTRAVPDLLFPNLVRDL